MILISGASRGIGRYLFNSYSKDDLKIIGLYNTTFPKKGLDNFIQADIRNLEELNKLLKPVISKSKKLILLNCAAINYNAFAHKANPEEWKNVVETNLIGTFNLIRVVLPKMRENNFGRIINFSSVVSVKGTPGVSAYAATKSAFVGLSKSLSIENATKRITVNNINLGYSSLGIIREVPEKFKNQLENSIPLSRLCKPEEILETVRYLIKTEYITGESININGGLT